MDPASPTTIAPDYGAIEAWKATIRANEAIKRMREAIADESVPVRGRDERDRPDLETYRHAVELYREAYAAAHHYCCTERTDSKRHYRDHARRYADRVVSLERWLRSV